MKTVKKILSVFLAILMLLSSAPLEGLTGIELPWFSTKAEAVGVEGYSPLAAVQWAKDHWNDTTSVLFGRGYWERGTGDCANFVSQCLYMGGLNMNSYWNSNGYKAHYSTTSDGSFIRAQQLYDYVCSIGGESIKNPSASQIEVGDLLFYRKSNGSRINHSAIVIDIVNNTPKIAYHSDSDSKGNAIKKVTTDWHCGRSASQTYLVKMNGAPCVSPNPRDFDVYTVGKNTTYLYKKASTSSSKLSTYKSGEYTHIYDTKTVGGVKWGYTQRYGTWGWVKLNLVNYQRNVTSGITSHLFGDWYTTKKATCVSNGEERRDCQRCNHYETRVIKSGGHVVTKKATCTEDAYCDLCGTLAQEATGHKWNNGVVSPDATCVNYGTKKYTCQNDNSHTYTVTLPVDPNKHKGSKTLVNKKDATCVESGYTGDRLCSDCGVVVEKGSVVKALGHNYTISASLPTCTQSGIVTRKCTRCSAMRSEYANENNTWSDWTTEVISGLPSSKVQTKKQYRYSDKSTTSSYDASLSGWTKSGSEWKQSGSGTVDYVSSFPSGFSTSHSLYSQYNKSPVSASESTTNKTTVSTSTIGYIYWHWCRGGSQKNINRKINDSKTSTYTTFHAFYSTEKFSYNSSAKSFTVGSGNSYGGCKDTYWWISTASGSSNLLEVKRCSYTNYKNLFYYYKWSNWSSWQDGYVSSGDTRKVETRTLYKYDLAALGHDFSVEGAYKAPTCTQPGYSGSVCSRCGAISKNTTVIPALGHLLYDSPVYESTKQEMSANGNATPLGYWYRTSASTDTKKVYHRDCARSCGYGEDKEENCVYVLTKEINASCNEDGKKIFTCTLHGETKESAIPATGHDWGEWFTTQPATCENQGNTMRVCQNDETHIENKDIPALDHTLTKVDSVDPKCETNGNIEYYVCDICDKIFGDSEGKNEISIEDTVVEPLGHSGLDKDGNEVWKRITEPKCGETGYEVLLCQREFDGEKCNHLIDEREIAGLEPIYREINRIEPTCAELGLIEYTCTRCEGTADAHGYFEDIDKIEHPWRDDITEKSTCTEYGRIYHVCSYCGEEELIEEIEPLGHIKGDEITIYPTCTKDGYTYWECQREGCDYSETIAEYDATGHDFNSETKNSTCIESGYTVHTCTNINRNTNETCLYNYTDGDNVALGHDLGEWYTVNEATCLEDGLERSDCSRCEYYVTKAIPATDHSLDTTSQAPTCTEDGYNLTVCKNENCDYREYEIVNATGHNYEETDVIPATCTEVEGVYMVCANDSSHTYLKHRDTEPLGHDFSEKIIDKAHLAKEATCTEAAEYYYDCARTGSSSNNGISCDTISNITFAYGKPLGHDWDDGVIDPSSTCNTHGTKTYTCKNDSSHTYTEEVALDPDKHVGKTYTLKKSNPTCTEDGYTGDIHCADCGVILTEGSIIAALGHDYGSWVDDENGKTHTKTCKRDICNDTVTEHKISANHKMSEIERVPAKCKENGYIKYKCDDCDYTYNEPIKATGHDWGEWEITTEPTYDSVGEKQQICKNDESHINKDIVPVLTRPSEDNENVTTDKTVDYDSLTGEAVIRLLASSNGKKITVNSRIPLDIVLVLDQSGSMEGQLNKKLKEAVESFNKSIYNDAVESGLDHRIAMVGFAMQDSYDYNKNDYPQYLNTEVLTTGGAPIKYNSLASNEMNKVYKDALVSVNVDNSLNPILTTATENIDSKGATATDLGLDMACKIFSQNENDGSRKRIVVLMTDGVPTYKSDYMDETADNAKEKANIIKNTYEADIYSVGVLSGNEVNKAKTFLKEVASKDDSNAPLYYDCSESNELISSFSKIAKESVTVKTDFTDVTLVDTVSKAFTLTSKQEQKLRADAIEKLGVSNSDIIVTRYADGTTEVKIQHITPKKIENGNDVKFVIDFSFSVTANENALVADSYVTNTDNAGVIVGVKDVYENNFTAPSDNVEEADGVVYFNINGITYHVLRVHAGDKVEQPEIDLAGGYTFSGWDIPDEITFDGGKYTIDATLTQDEYTVTWITDGETTTEKYHFGDIITVPNVKKNANGDAFDSWDKEVPTTMPAEDLTFTASYSKHEHKWVTSTTTSDKDVTAFSNVYCELCGESPDNTLSYTIKGKNGWKDLTYDLKLVDAEQIKINVDGTITISLPIPDDMKNARNFKIYRTEEDGSKTELPCTKRGSYVTFTTDHFSEYKLMAIYECDESGEHVDANCDKNCDICGVKYPELGHKYDSVVIAPTCTEGGYTKHTCSVCGNSYTDNKISALGHNDSNGDGKCDNCGATLQDIANNCGHLCHSTNGFVQFIWKIVRFFCKLFGTNKVCSCGVKHW